jgi:hypothetical protein
MKKDLLKRIYEMSRIMQKIPQHKGKALYSEIVHEYMDRNIRTIDIDDPIALQNEEDRKMISDFTKFIDQKLKFARVVNCIPKDSTIDDDFAQVYQNEESISAMSIDELIRPDIFLNIEMKEKGLSEGTNDADINGKNSSETKQIHKDPKIEEIQNFVAGKYYIKDGRLVKGEPNARATSQYSNWTAGNVDPEDLERHKQLLERQHFGGPFWEGKQRPKSIEDEMPEYEPEESSYGNTPVYMLGHKQGEQKFKKVRG